MVRPRADGGGGPKGGSRPPAGRRRPSERLLRRRGSRRKRWLILACILLLLAGIGAGAWWLAWRSELLSVHSVQVEGVAGKDRQLVLGVADVPIGTAMVEVPTAAIESRVASLDWVRRAIVRLAWPNAVVVVIEPRQALARDPDLGWVVDADGTVFQSNGQPPRGLPVVRATDVGRVEAMRALASLPADLRGRVAVVIASTRDDIRFNLASGALVRWGSAEQGQLKAQVLGALLSRRALVYDVSTPLAPATRGERPGRRTQSP